MSCAEPQGTDTPTGACPQLDEPAGGRLELDEPGPGIARLRIVNPAKRGALDHAILAAFVRELGRAQARCVIIGGQPGIFSAGYDLDSLAAQTRATQTCAGAPGSERTRAGAAGSEQTRPGQAAADEPGPEPPAGEPFAAALRAIESYPYPTLAALSGHAIGGGLELALACDLRVAASSIKLGMPPAKLGLVYSHSGIRRFIDAIGAPRTSELFLLGGLIDAPTAHAWGLVNELAEPEALEDRALALARTLADNAPLAQRGNKRVIAAVLREPGRPAPPVKRELERLRTESFASEDFREALRAFAQRRTPRFRGR